MKKLNVILTISLLSMLQAIFATNAYSCPDIINNLIIDPVVCPVLVVFLVIIMLSAFVSKKVINNIKNNGEPISFKRYLISLKWTKIFSAILFITLIILISKDFFNKNNRVYIFILAQYAPYIFVFCIFITRIINKLNEVQELKNIDYKPLIRFITAETILTSFFLVCALIIELVILDELYSCFVHY